VPAVDARDDGAKSGFIALQVHNASQAGWKVRFRNIRLAELPAATKP